MDQAVEDYETQRAIIEELEVSSDYRARRERIAAFNATSPILKRGIALTPVMFGISFTLIPLNQAGALVHVYSDGSIHLNHGGTEMGQGLFTKVAQIVAEEFGVPLAFRAHHRDQHRQGSQRLADRRLVRDRPQRHGGENRGRRDQGANDRLSPPSTWNVAPEAIEFRDGRVFARQQVDELRRAREGLPPRRACSCRTPAITRRRRSIGIALEGEGASVLLLRLRRRLLGSRDRHADRRDAGAARRPAARRRRLDQSGASTWARSRAPSFRAWAG